MLTALVRLCRGNAEAAADVLGLGPTQRGEVGVNARLRQAPCAPAIDVYTGVLFDSLDAGSLGAAATRRLANRVAIASALWGLLRPGDPIPAYRLSGSVSLPEVGALGSVWRAPVARELARTEGLVVDLRSSTYVALSPLTPEVAARSATVRVLIEKDGRRSVVSHFNKATKGRLVRALVTAPGIPADVDQLAHAITRAGYRVEVTPGRNAKAAVVDVVVDSL